MPLNDPTTDIETGPPPAVDLQQSLQTLASDLEGLQRLLSGASERLLTGFFGASHQLREVLASGAVPPVGVARALAHLDHAVTALQFQDLASQAIAHAQQRLHQYADRAGAGDGSAGADCTVVGSAPLRPHPVLAGMHAGSVDLF